MIKELFNIDFLFVGIAIAGNLIMGFMVAMNKRKSATGVFFLALTIAISVWSIINFASYSVLDERIALWLVRLVMFFAAPIGALFLFLIDAFPGDKLRMKKKYAYSIVVVTLLTMILSLTPFLFSEVTINPGQAPSPSVGFGIISFIFVPVITDILALVILIKRILKSTGIEKIQYKYLLSGISIMLILILILDFILPTLFKNTMFIPFSALFTLPFVIFTAYAIVKHKLFNVKVAGVALLVFGLAIINFIEVTQANDIIFIIYRSAVLFFVLIFGIILIRTVLKEVKQREEIARMAEDVRRAYVLEKKAKEDIDRAYAIEQKANEELKKIDQYKNDFLRQTQHDLRRPLTILMGYSNLLLDGTFGKLPKKAIDVIKKIESVTQEKIKDVNNFLDLEQFKLGKGVVALTPGIELSPLMEEIMKVLVPVARSKGIYLKLEPSDKAFKISADREKLKAAIFNVIDNAVKYTPKGGVTVNIKDNEASNSLAIIVKDTGIGIPAEKVKKIFEEEFERTEQAKKTASGSGVGLHLSAQIIELHKGKVWVESQGEGSGSTFYVELPISKESDETSVSQ